MRANRFILSISVLGMLLSMHLFVQKGRNFDQGCWGISTTAPAVGCTNSELEKASRLFGISVAAWGYGFYFLIGLLSFGKLLLSPRLARGCYLISEVTVAIGFPYTLYLFYVQAVVARAFCPLCVVSGVLVTTLFVIHVCYFWSGHYPQVADDKRPIEIGYASAMGFTGMGLLAALMLFVNEVGTRRLDQGDSAKQFTLMLGRSLPKFIAEEKLIEMKPALYDREQPPLKQNEWINPGTPFLGGRDMPVKVVVFLDPNCPGCVREFANIEKLAGIFRDRATFYVFSRVLWDFSRLQSQALELARTEGKYFEMWRAQFSHQQNGGLSLVELEGLFDEVRMDKSDLQKRLTAVRAAVDLLRERAIAAGIRGTPTIFINGAAVDLRSLDEKSLARLIEEAGSAHTGGAQTVAPGKTEQAIAISENAPIIPAVSPTSGPPQLP
jgi:uncharacterized membrane protein